MPTILEMALLSMDVYEKREGGSMPLGAIGNFSLSQDRRRPQRLLRPAYTFSGGTVIAYRGTDGAF